MSYTPKFCCQCGDKIDRVDWNITTSRRFCDVCENQFKFYDWLPQIVTAFGILLCIIGIGSFWQKSGSSEDKLTKQFVISSSNINKNSAVKTNTEQFLSNQNVNGLIQTQPNNLTAVTKSPSVLTAKTTKQPEITPNESGEKIYFCGAQTKKGSPCSHKVKGGGRCWQHQGQPAMMAQEKLLVSQ